MTATTRRNVLTGAVGLAASAALPIRAYAQGAPLKLGVVDADALVMMVAACCG